MGAKPKAKRAASSSTKKAKAAEKPQRERFIEAARKAGVDETGQEFESLFRRVIRRRQPQE